MEMLPAEIVTEMMAWLPDINSLIALSKSSPYFSRVLNGRVIASVASREVG